MRPNALAAPTRDRYAPLFLSLIHIFLGPGHVSTVIGQRPYRFVPAVYGKPLVTAGFEPLDVLQTVSMLLTQIRQGRCEVENQYARVVSEEGNPRALAVLEEVFELRPHFEWRGRCV